MRRVLPLLLATLVWIIWPDNGSAYTDITLYNSFAGKVDFTATGRSLKTSDTAVASSGSSTLALPAGTTVKAAYLYWAGSWNSQIGTSAPDYAITLTRTGSSALNITSADRSFTEDFARFDGGTDSNEDYFGGFKDVTAYVQSGGAGTYTVSNLSVWTNTPHSSVSTIVAGWAMIVVYEYPESSTQPLRVVNVYDGFKLYYSASGSDHIDLTPSNFQIPSSNISGKHGHLSWEGDVGNSNSYENLYFNGHSITSTANPLNNQYNSTRTLPSGDPNSGLSSTAGNDSNALAMDLDFYDVSQYLSAGDTSVSTRYQTGTDMVLLNAEVLSVTNSNVADLSVTATGNGPFVAGANGSYTVSVTNNGPSTAGSVQVTAALPAGLAYVNTPSGVWEGVSTDDESGSTVVFTYTGSLPVASGATLPDLVFNAAVDVQALDEGGQVTSVFTVGGSTFDNHQGNNSVSVITDAAAMTASLSSSARGLAKAGDSLTYSATLTSVGSVPLTGIVVNGGAMQGGTCVTNPFRVTEYPVTAAQFSGTTYELTLNQNLAANYFVMVQGSDGSGSTNLGPNSCYIALTSDPTGTGDLAVSSAANRLGFTRGASVNGWAGVITVVECLNDQAVNGFKLLGVERVAHTGTATTGTDTFASGWTNLSRIMLMGGYNGAGCDTSEGTAANTKTCHARIYPTGSGTISWSRDSGGATLATATSTVMVVEWGTAWTVQRVQVTGNNGGNGVNATTEYNTASLGTSVSRDHTFVWGTGHTNDNGAGDAAEGVLITLGNGVAQNATENTVAVGLEYANNSVNFEVYTLTHPQLHVDYRFKTQGDAISSAVSVTVDSAGSQRMAIVSNGCRSTDTVYPMPMLSARYQSGSSVLLSRQRSGTAFAAWVQGVDFSDVTTTVCPTTLAIHESMTVSYTYIIDTATPDESLITNSVFAYSSEIPASVGVSASATDYIPGYMSANSSAFYYEDNLFCRDLEGSGLNDTIYTGGYGFAPLTCYTTAYYDAGGNLVSTDTASCSSGSGFFYSSYDNSSDTAAYGTWTAVVMPSSFTPRSTLSAQMTAVPTGVVDVFTVASGGKVEFTDPAGNPVDGYDMSAGETSVYIKVTDSAANTSAGIVNTVSVTVVDNVTGDSETVILTETGANTGVFTNASGGLTVSTSTGTGNNSGILRVAGENSIRVDYWDTSGTLYSDEVYIPLLALITSFSATEENGSVVIEWKTAAEMGTLGFYLKRKDTAKGKYRAVHQGLLTGLLVSPQGGTYRLVDSDAVPGKTYTYKLTEVEVKGRRRDYGPFKVTAGGSLSSLSESGTAAKKSRSVFLKAGSFSRSPHVKKRVSASKILARWNTAKLKSDLAAFYSGYGQGARARMKITVTEEGLCYVPASEIASSLNYTESRVAALIGTGNLVLTNKGFTVAYLPATGNQGIYFYGESPNSNYTDQSVYMLKPGKGSIMTQAVTGGGTSAGSAAGAYTFMDTVHVEEDLYPLTAYYTDPYDDYWVGEYVVAGDASLGTLTVEVPSPGLDRSGGDALLTVTLKGGSLTTAFPDHTVNVAVNGVSVGQGAFDGTQKAELAFRVSPAILDVTNTVTLTGVLAHGAPYSIFYFDSVDLTYPRSYTAAGGVLSATGRGQDLIRVAGFTGSDVKVFDITDKKKPVLITDTFKEQVDGKTCVSFRSRNSEDRYLAVDTAECGAPFDWDGVSRSNLKSRMNGATYLVITPKNLLEGALALAEYRKSRGYSVKTVVLDDIMNEFNDGTSHPEAIKDFLDYAYNNWRIRPGFVALVGDGSYDYKNIRGYNDCLIPPLMTGTPDGLFPSDNQLVDVAGDDGKPDMAIGRFPVHSSEDMLVMVEKIKAYEKSGGSWTDRVIMAVDDADQGGNFPEFNIKVEACIPKGLERLRFTLGQSSFDTVKTRMIQALNQGAFLFNYLGHGGIDRLAEEGLLESADISTLANGNRQPVMALMTCATSLFAVPGYDSIAENLVTAAGKGAIAVWAPSGLSAAPLATVLDQEFMRAVFAHRNGTLGEAVRLACRNYTTKIGDTDLTDVFVLMGDPALRFAD